MGLVSQLKENYMTTAFADNFEELTGLTPEEFEAGKAITTDVIGLDPVAPVETPVETKVVSADSPSVQTA